MAKSGDYQVVRVTPDSPHPRRQILNTVSDTPRNYKSMHKEQDGRSTTTAKERLKIAQEIADGWASKGPWPESKFVVERVE